jgi:hypothetical protein
VAWPEKGGTCDPVLCTIRIRIIPNHRARKIRKISKSFRAKIASALVGWWMLAVEGPERRGSGGVMAERKASTTGDPSRAELLFDHLSAECASSGGVKGASVAKDVSVLLRSICVVLSRPALCATSSHDKGSGVRSDRPYGMATVHIIWPILVDYRSAAAGECSSAG